MNRRDVLATLGATATLPWMGAAATARAEEQAARPPLPRLRVHREGRYLETEGGKPFFWLADTGWTVMHYATREEASYYLRTRAHQGFSVIQTMLLVEQDGLRTPSAWGELPFEQLDPGRPREAYFRRIDAFFAEAAELGLYVAPIATWGDKLTAPWGDGPRLFTVENLPVARNYGRFLGERYRDYTNLVWFMGGDRPARLGGHPDNWSEGTGMEAGFPKDHDWTPVWRAMAEGLLEGSGGKALLTYHPQGGAARTSVFLHGESWLHINSMQSGHGGGHDQPVWDWITEDLALRPSKPTFDSEPNYEDHPYNPWPQWDPATGYFRDHDVRKQCYRSVFAGGMGVTYGHHAVWQWAGARRPVINFPDRDWLDALHRPGARQIGYLRALALSRPFFARLPDQGLVAGDPGRGGRHIRAMRDREATYAWVYLPEMDQEVVLDLGVFGGKTLQPWWFDPRTGFAWRLEPCKAERQVYFRSPPHGPDWVLALDAVEAGYGPPGVGVAAS